MDIIRHIILIWRDCRCLSINRESSRCKKSDSSLMICDNRGSLLNLELVLVLVPSKWCWWLDYSDLIKSVYRRLTVAIIFRASFIIRHHAINLLFTIVRLGLWGHNIYDMALRSRRFQLEVLWHRRGQGVLLLSLISNSCRSRGGGEILWVIFNRRTLIVKS
jgi:hypothetical protein